MQTRHYYIYLLTNQNNRVLYTGVTNDLSRRLHEHRQKLVKGFTAQYNMDKLVFFEVTSDVQAAIARWPGTIPAGRVSDEPWAFWDFLPTAAELANALIPDGCKTDGHSLASFLKGGPAPKRDHFYWELHEGTSLQAVRFGEWKAVRNGPEKPIELYDLKTDAAESHDLAAEKPELVGQAEALMKAARTEDPDWPLVQRQPGKKKKK